MGVFLCSCHCIRLVRGLPHARGGVSDVSSMRESASESSPRPWGCFHIVRSLPNWQDVFPTPVGVFPSRRSPSACARGLPHARGGVSSRLHLLFHLRPSSPRPWGCFQGYDFMCVALDVFPTPVGVFLVTIITTNPKGCLPHARGGVSTWFVVGLISTGSSPRPWGCFRLQHTTMR